jgi:hypothetical protein
MDFDQSSTITDNSTTHQSFSTTTKTNSTTSPWSVKGITFETRASVKRASKISNMKMGAWINQILHREATVVLKSKEALPPNQEVVPADNRYDSLEKKFDSLQSLVEKALLSKNEGKSKKGKKSKKAKKKK